MPTSFTQWWNALIRYRVAALLAFASVIAVTVCVILYSPRVYRSTSRLLLRIGRENSTLDPTAAITGDMITPLNTRENEMETALGVMQSRMIMEQVVDRIGVEQILSESPDSEEGVPGADEQPASLISKLTRELKAKIANIDPVPDREMAIRALEGGFDISAPSKSSVVTVEFKSKNPQVATNIVEAWVECYLGQHSKVNRTQGTYPFFAEQDVLLKQQLDSAHSQLREAKNRGGFVTLAGQQQLLESQLETVRSELLKLDADLVESTARIESVGNMLNTTVNATTTQEVRGVANEARDEMRSLLFQLEVVENEYAAKYKEFHPKLVAIREQLANAREIVESQDQQRTQITESTNPIHRQLSESRLIDVASQQAMLQRKQTLLKQKIDLLDEITGLNEYEEELAKLTRNAETLEERYKLHSVRLEQARLDEVLEEQRITSINVIQPASLEQRPVSPNKKLCAAGGLFAAFAIAISLPVLLDARRQYASNGPTRMTAAKPRAAIDPVLADQPDASTQPIHSLSSGDHESDVSLTSESVSRPR